MAWVAAMGIACGGAVPPAPLHAGITPDDLLSALDDSIGRVGYVCEATADGDATCGRPDGLRMLVSWDDHAHQVVFIAAFGLLDGHDCGDAVAAINQSNLEYTVGAVACMEDTLIVRTNLLAPTRGFDGEELGVWLDWWTSATVAMLKSTSLRDLLR